ncbi:hypothetical protein WA026_003713 [Henosepilachna vigintioctopunctata]
MTETVLEETSQVETVIEETKNDKDKCNNFDCDEDHEEEKEFSYSEHMTTFAEEVMEYFHSTIKSNKCLDYDKRYAKAKELMSFKDAPPFLQHNPFILTGYRGILNTAYCIQSMFWWTNESINIWSHLFGLMLFTGLVINDLLFLKVEASIADKFMVASVLVCFQFCMFLSAIYHTFNCRSARDCDLFLSFDLFGIALSLLAIYTSGIYYAFWCNSDLQNFYISTVTVIFALAMVLQLPQLNIDAYVKMLVFVGWAAYGVVPTFHWTIVMGGFENPIVSLLLPRVLGMYCITGIAFFIYITKIPERFYKGRFDFIGHSHQWWHTFVVLALYYWHNTGMIYVEYRLNHACANHMRLP